ncbi:MAG: DUF4143 domain-containing protein [Myxococcota bacterium]
MARRSGAVHQTGGGPPDLVKPLRHLRRLISPDVANTGVARRPRDAPLRLAADPGRSDRRGRGRGAGRQARAAAARAEPDVALGRLPRGVDLRRARGRASRTRERVRSPRCVRPLSHRPPRRPPPDAGSVRRADRRTRALLRGGFAPLDARVDVGHLLEGWVFSELHKRFPEPGAVRYWRTKNGAEVDFILEPRPGERVAIEVKASGVGARFNLSRAARSFIEAYQPTDFLLVHRGEAHEALEGSTRVRWLPAELLPEALDAFLTPGDT